MWEWVQKSPAVPDELRAELSAATATTFPSRRLQSAYLGWVLRDVIARLPRGMRVHLHRTRAVGLTEEGRHPRSSRWPRAPPLRVDAVVLASGHPRRHPPTADELALAAGAQAEGCATCRPSRPPTPTCRSSRRGRPCSPAALGLAFVDLAVLLFEGRGGRFVDGAYVPSGRGAGADRRLAPRFHLPLQDPLRPQGRAPAPAALLGPDVTDPLIAAGRSVDLAAQVWPLMAKEIAWGWYHELSSAIPISSRGSGTPSPPASPP